VIGLVAKRKLLAFFILGVLVVSLAACGNGEDDDVPEDELQEFTLDELAEYDGQDGADAYVAVDGYVYDVTDSAQWTDGSHQGEVTAGADLTQELEDNPQHGEEMLDNVPRIGILVDEDDEADDNDELQEYTLDELSAYDGQDGADAYVAVDGYVYDVTDSAQWTDGSHQGEVTAGADLTQELEDNPQHGAEMLDNVPKIGILVDEDTDGAPEYDENGYDSNGY